MVLFGNFIFHFIFAYVYFKFAILQFEDPSNRPSQINQLSLLPSYASPVLSSLAHPSIQWIYSHNSILTHTHPIERGLPSLSYGITTTLQTIPSIPWSILQYTLSICLSHYSPAPPRPPLLPLPAPSPYLETGGVVLLDRPGWPWIYSVKFGVLLIFFHTWYF